LKLEDATAYTAGCFRGEPASCSFACPFRLDVRSFLEKAGKGRWNAAYKALRNAVVFPGIVSVLCDQPCRDHCQRTPLGDEAIALREVEAACLRFTKDRKPESFVIPPKEQRIAVVGAGLAGLSCALNLAQKKYKVTVFEKLDGWGGSLRGHPRFAEFDTDLGLQFSAVEVEFRFGTEVTSLAALAGFDAAYVATGAGGESFGLGEGCSPEGFTTVDAKVFMGGELCGATLMEGIAQGVEASKVIETFLQTGRPGRVRPDDAAHKCERYVKHEGVARAPLVEPAGPDGYSEDEARTEASRCLLCDCGDCIAACEMLASFKKDPHRIATDVYGDMNVNPPFSTRAVTREVYSCNICGHCKSVCPEHVDIGALSQFSREARTSSGAYPAAFHDFWLREMDFATTEGAFVAAPPGKQTCAYAFYPGCQLGADVPEHVLETYEALRDAYDLGVMLGCCGAPAYWAGDEARLRDDLERTKKAWEELGRPTLVFACATCAGLFSSMLPEIPRVSLYELLATSGGATPAAPFARAAVFDPCSARDDTGMEAAVRELAAKAGVTLEELAERNRCCGYGGHIRVANPRLYDEITQHRAEAGAQPYVVYCANCREVFASRGKECAHVLDLALGREPDPRVPTLQQKRDNSLRVKRELMKQMQDRDFEPEEHPWDPVNLIIGDELQATLDDRLIAAADLKEAIWQAETSGDKFHDEGDGMSLACLVRPVITYWVQYREIAPDTYEVVSAYYHRMRFQGGE
jgi:Fe-S oxidoreductase